MVTGGADSASDSNRSARSARTGRPASGRSPCMDSAGTRPGKGPGGRVPRRCGTGLLRLAHRGGAKRRCRRAAAAGRWYPRVSLGMARVAPERRGCSRRGAGRNLKCTGKTTCCFSARKRLLGRVSRPIYWASVYNQNAVTERSLCLRPSESD
jgi:hypothetical protein